MSIVLSMAIPKNKITTRKDFQALWIILSPQSVTEVTEITNIHNDKGSIFEPTWPMTMVIRKKFISRFQKVVHKARKEHFMTSGKGTKFPISASITFTWLAESGTRATECSLDWSHHHHSERGWIRICWRKEQLANPPTHTQPGHCQSLYYI